MLQKLRVKNYALIKDLDIDFGDGLTIITGETGAGKSILLGALSLILGTRADTSVLLEKTDKCIVEGTFKIEGYGMDSIFDQYGIDYDPVTIIRREINPAGKSRAFINDTPSTLNQLKELGEKLIDVHSQHQTLMLKNSSFQLSVLDSFSDTTKLRERYTILFRKYQESKNEYQELKTNQDKIRADYDYYLFQLKQLSESGLVAGEQEEMENEQEMLLHSEEIRDNLNMAAGLLANENSSILGMLKETKNSLSKVKSYLEDGDELLDRTESAYIELNDISSEIEKRLSVIEFNPERLSLITERLDLLFSLMQKHRVNTVEQLIQKKEELKDITDRLMVSDDRVKELESLLSQITKELKELSDKISAKRKSVIGIVESKITEQLKLLGIPNARFIVDLRKIEDFTPTGTDIVDFMFSANKQISPENLTKVASGGELSRVMLSLKSFLSHNNSLPTIIFDEIDSGVSGEVADKVGVILTDMGLEMQVINITHLPQVAARGSRHFHVYKDNTGNSTVTRIKLLTNDERLREIARLLSGSEITDAAINNAKELMEN